MRRKVKQTHEDQVQFPLQRTREENYSHVTPEVERGVVVDVILPGSLGQVDFHHYIKEATDQLNQSYYKTTYQFVYNQFFNACYLPGESIESVWDSERSQMVTNGPFGLLRAVEMVDEVAVAGDDGDAKFLHSGALIENPLVKIEWDDDYWPNQLNVGDRLWVVYLTGSEDLIFPGGAAASKGKKGKWVPLRELDNPGSPIIMATAVGDIPAGGDGSATIVQTGETVTVRHDHVGSDEKISDGKRVYLTKPKYASPQWRPISADCEDEPQTLIWGGSFADNTTYGKNTLVTDGDWLMVANKSTSSKAAPQTTAIEEFDITDGVAVPIASSNTGAVRGGQEYTMSQGGWIRKLEVNVPEITANTHYRLRVGDITTPAAPVWQNIVLPALSSGSWVEVELATHLYPSGAVISVVLDALTYSSTGTWNHLWGFGGIAESGAPTSGDWTRQALQNVIRVHDTDDGATDRSANLGLVIAGSTIKIENNSDATQYWEYYVTKVTDQTTHFEFEVVLIATGTTGGVPDAATCKVTATNPTPLATKYYKFTSHWVANEPSWATAEGNLRLSGVDQASQADHAFGVRIEMQPALVSPDWDLARGI